MLLAAAGCSDVEVEMSAYGVDAESVRLELKELGRLDAAGLKARRDMGDIDGTSFLAECGEQPCRVVELTVFVENKTGEPMMPPVVRMKSPEGRARRLPVALRAQEISPGRIGRIRWLVSLWPEEAHLVTDISGSVSLN
jgi:hypothetical protein